VDEIFVAFLADFHILQKVLVGFDPHSGTIALRDRALFATRRDFDMFEVGDLAVLCLILPFP